MDMLTYRKFKSGMEFMQHLNQDAARPCCLFDRRLIELQKKFAMIYDSLNPYTGLAYKDDPAIILTEIINEGICQPAHNNLYYKSNDKMYYEWLEERGLNIPKGEVIIHKRSYL